MYRMNGMNLWGPRPFFPPGAPGLEGSSPFPIPAHLSQMGMLALSSGAGDRGLAQAEKDGKDAPHHPLGMPMFRPGEHPISGLYSYQNFIKAHYELQQAAMMARNAQAAGEEGALHPVSHLALNAHPSAFVPAKRAKLDEREEGEIERRIRGEEDRMSDRLSGNLSGPPTPVSPSSRHTLTPDRSSGLDLTLDNSHRGSPAGSTEARSPAFSLADGIVCPVCRCRLEPEEVHAHLTRELMEIDHKRRSPDDARPSSNSASRMADSKSRYDSYLKCKTNREQRLSKLKRRKRASDEMYNGVDPSVAATAATAATAAATTTHTHEVSMDEEQIDIVSCDDKTECVAPPTPVPCSKLSPSQPLSSSAPPTTARSQCNGCKESFENNPPLTSKLCWHVHCSKCWETNQNACPQCKQAVSASDLQRIFL